MIRYLSPDSSDVARRISVAHMTYSGMESSSKPMNSVTRFDGADEHDHAEHRGEQEAVELAVARLPHGARPRHESSTVPAAVDDEDQREHAREVVHRQRAGHDRLVLAPGRDRRARRRRRASSSVSSGTSV